VVELYLRLLDRILTPMILIVSAVLLLRGHDQPGGGFIAGLLVAAAFALQILARGADEVAAAIGQARRMLVAGGLLLAVASALYGLFVGGGFFRSVWWTIDVGPVHYKIGTPVLFDFGVFLVVIGVTVTFLLGLSESVITAPQLPLSLEREEGQNDADRGDVL
jgi:multicomponent Na+:H+ antiporter subunit B